MTLVTLTNPDPLDPHPHPHPNRVPREKTTRAHTQVWRFVMQHGQYQDRKDQGSPLAAGGAGTALVICFRGTDKGEALGHT